MANQMKKVRSDNQPEQPLVSVLTPSYNSVRYLEETIQSVLQQDYPHIEHIVVDGGSTDGTVEVLRRYPHLRWISEPDGGQSDALNKALDLASGTIIGWLNADDLYEPDAVKAVIEFCVQHPQAHVLHGNCTVFASSSTAVRHYRGACDRRKVLEPWRGFHGAYQPSIFYRREAIERIGRWAVDLHYVMDYDLLLRLTEYYAVDYIDVDLSRFRLHPEQKGALAWHKFVREFMISVERYWYRRDLVRYCRYRFAVRHFYALALLEQITKGSVLDPKMERTILRDALVVAPDVLRYAWVRRRCVREVLGPSWSNQIRRWLSEYRQNR